MAFPSHFARRARHCTECCAMVGCCRCVDGGINSTGGGGTPEFWTDRWRVVCSGTKSNSDRGGPSCGGAASDLAVHSEALGTPLTAGVT